MTEESESGATVRFSSSLAVIVYTRPLGQAGQDWQELDRGPGYFHVPADHEIGLKIKGADDKALKMLITESREIEVLRMLDLAENRNVTNIGLAGIGELKSLSLLNLSSCSITSSGLEPLKQLTGLKRLNLSFCNRLNDSAMKILASIRSLEYLDLQGCPGITNGGISRIRRRNLEINR